MTSSGIEGTTKVSKLKLPVSALGDRAVKFEAGGPVQGDVQLLSGIPTK